MNKAVIVLLGALAADALFASEVGAPYPQLASSATANFAISIAEAGASTSSAIQPSEKVASNLELEVFNSGVEGFSAKMNQELEAKISEKISNMLSY